MPNSRTSHREEEASQRRELKAIGLEWLIACHLGEPYVEPCGASCDAVEYAIRPGHSGDLLSHRGAGALLPEFWRRFHDHGGGLEWAPPPLDGRLIAWTISPRRLRRRIGVIGSRIGRRPDLARHFSIGLREIARELDTCLDVVFIAKSSPQCDLVRRSIQRSQIDSIVIDESAASSWRKWKTLVTAGQDELTATAIISPIVLGDKSQGSSPTAARDAGGEQKKRQVALADRLSSALSDLLFAPNVRSKGITSELLEEKAATDAPTCCWLELRSDDDRFVNSLFNAGVDVRRHDAKLRLDDDLVESTRARSMRDEARDDLVIRRLLERPLLQHSTRAPSGPWPMESERQFLDEILATCEPRDAFASLKRILDRRLLARTQFGLRGGHQAVCLSASSLEWVSSARVFRPHRMRWDFEPYGLCFSRQALLEIGARPVAYADDDSLWTRLSDDQQLFFQLGSSNDGAIDWRAEQEWRLPIDVSLNELTPGDYVAFTKNADEAADLRRTSPCPVAPLATLVEWCVSGE